MKKYLSMKRLSIQQRLSFTICLLLLLVIVVYGAANYYSLKKATLVIAKQRVTKITRELSQTFEQSARVVTGFESAMAENKTINDCLLSEGARFKAEAAAELTKLHRDKTWICAELTDSSGTTIVQRDFSGKAIGFSPATAIKQAGLRPESAGLGKIYDIGGLMYFPVICPVMNNHHVKGYLIAWLLLKGTRQSVAQLSQLVGGNAAFYLVNADQSLWTDMITPVKSVQEVKSTGRIFTYTNAYTDKKMLADTRLIPRTAWFIMVEFPENAVFEGMDNFLKWIIVAGIVLLGVGIFSASALSRSIVKPINQLTAAAVAISEGSLTTPASIEVLGQDELGKMAAAFNRMVAEIYRMNHELEGKVEERTAQLEMVNKELEGFSYSVSHDLRTPLRAVMGYAVMLKEDYEAELDDEARRIIKNIINNARMMGQLIDDLLAFSRLGKKELVKADVDMRQLCESVCEELLQNETPGKYRVDIQELPATRADAGLIKQALANLLGNAIKYSSKKEKPEITVGFGMRDGEPVYFVQDNGAGFSMAYADKLFGVFQRLHSLEEFEGTGVGLALVKRIIDKHKGRLWAESEENKGAVFYFTLPDYTNHERH